MILKGVNSKGPLMRGLVSLDSKEGELRDLYHWWWITLLIVIYQISSRACKYGVNSKFILDNIVSTPTLHWAKASKQPTVILKLNFSKAYNKASWVFLFFMECKGRGLVSCFIKLVELLFQNGTAMVNLNGSPKESFNIKHRVRQCCPLVPCVFLILGEVQHTLLRRHVERVDLGGIPYHG